jgi:membrane associated rhomboid family serine protease
MIVPWGTDAPVYHYPFATIGIIALNTAVFLATLGVGRENVEPWMLELGNGIHPIQWVTSEFIHAGIGHLVGNMVFLWAFGLVVEGKLGWWGFLLSYLGIGAVSGALLQVLPVGGDSGEGPSYMLGASDAIYGVLALALVWAPKNDLYCISFFRLVPMQWEIPIMGFALFYIGLQVILVLFSGGALLNALSHTSGAALGFALGVLILKKGWVDCENWDLFAVIGNRTGKPAVEKSNRPLQARRSRADSSESPIASRTVDLDAPGGFSDLEQRNAGAIQKVERLLGIGDRDAAVRAFDMAARTLPDWPERKVLAGWIQRMIKDAAAADAVPLMRSYCRRFPDQADRVRLRLAQVYLDQQRPKKAIASLEPISQDRLPPDLAALKSRLLDRARQMEEDGVYELDDGE